MPIRPSALARQRAVPRLASALAAALLAALALPASARPDVDSDKVRQFLVRQGLVDANGTVKAQPGAASLSKPAAPPAVTAPAPASAAGDMLGQVRDRASDMVMSAMNFLGVPYRRGGNSADEGFDCSGFTRHVFEQSLGLLLPRRADAQATAAGLEKVSRDELKPGDLVFFNTLRRTFSHVGIYIGEGKFIHAPRTGANVRIDNLEQSYWARRYTGARRAAIDGLPAEDTARHLGE